MATEFVWFPTNKTSVVVELIRRGLRDEKDAEIKKDLTSQCKDLVKRSKKGASH